MYIAEQSEQTSKHGLALIWLLAASSSFVFVEPAPYDILSILLFAGFFATGLKAPAGIQRPLLLLGIYLAANVAATIFVFDPVESVRSLSVRFFLVAVWVLLVSLIKRDPLRVSEALWNGYIFAAIAACVSGIGAYFGVFGDEELLLVNDRVKAFFKDPNVFGPFLIPVLLHLLVRIEDKRSFSTILSTGTCLLLIIGVLLSFSRGAWLNAVVSMSAYLLLRLLTERDSRDRIRLILASAILVLAGIGSVGVALTSQPVKEMFAKRAQVQSYDLEAQGGRFSTQRAALERAGDSPLGIGPGQSDLARNFGMSTHNLYLHVLVESGWIGAMAFYGFLAVTVFESWRFLRRQSPVQKEFIASFAALLGILAQSFFIDSTHWRHMYLLIALLWGLMLAYGGRRRAPMRFAGVHIA